jgi:hypothetical protein
MRARVASDWTVADKTGTGSYGTTNDVGIAWPPGRGPIVLAVLSPTGRRRLSGRTAGRQDRGACGGRTRLIGAEAQSPS